MATTLANWNGQEMPLDEVRVSVLDRAFLFGDAVYEVIRLYDGKLWMYDRHIGRLETGLKALRIAGVNIDVLKTRIEQTVKNSGIAEALVYIQVTRGVAKRTHHYPEKSEPNQLIYVEQFDDPCKQMRESGVNVISYHDYRWQRNDLKVTSLMANCMAAQVAHENGCIEVVQIGSDGYVTEGSHTSIFAVKDGKILVSPSSSRVLPGITKQQILELSAAANIGLNETRVKKEELKDVDEMFLTGTPEEIVPIIKVDDLVIGDGKPGPVTRKLQQAFKDSVQNWLNK
ncbi:MAG: aminotransferase class IV [Candidatus Obscuribacterales bacterium]|nr:aminotransferase class IV [Candidatus Obscuribacterales bacterium]